jgi:TPR repeat protein
MGEAQQGICELQGPLGPSLLHPGLLSILWANKYAVMTTEEMTEFQGYKAQAEEGSRVAKYFVGLCYYNGEGVAKDQGLAVSWWQKAADQDHAQAQFNLGVCYFNGIGLAQDKHQAVLWYRKAADQDHAQAQFNLGICYFNGVGVAKDLALAVWLYRKAAEKGYAQAQCELGNDYLSSKPQQAVYWFKKSAGQGEAAAQKSLGDCYFFGEGVEEDIDEGMSWYHKAAEKGNADAQSSLGLIYRNGHGGVMKSLSLAVTWYRKAAHQGDPWSQYHLSNCYYTGGEGVKMDMVEAYAYLVLAYGQWYADEKIAEQRNSIVKLGEIYKGYSGEITKDYLDQIDEWQGKAAKRVADREREMTADQNAEAKKRIVQLQNEIVSNISEKHAFEIEKAIAESGSARHQFKIGNKADHDQAALWYRRAADQGHSMAQYLIGARYYFGEGVAKNKINAYVYWNLAGLTEDARAKLVVLEKEMTAKQLAAGQKRLIRLRKVIASKMAVKKAGK